MLAGGITLQDTLGGSRGKARDRSPKWQARSACRPRNQGHVAARSDCLGSERSRMAADGTRSVPATCMGGQPSALTNPGHAPEWRARSLPTADRHDMLRRLLELAGLFLKLGTISFGGPAVTLAMMEEEVVRRRQWITRGHFLDLVGATNLIPGPNAIEMAGHIGYCRAGLLGSLVGGLASPSGRGHQRCCSPGATRSTGRCRRSRPFSTASSRPCWPWSSPPCGGWGERHWPDGNWSWSASAWPRRSSSAPTKSSRSWPAASWASSCSP